MDTQVIRAIDQEINTTEQELGRLRQARALLNGHTSRNVRRVNRTARQANALKARAAVVVPPQRKKLHWTQKPENKLKVMRQVRRANRVKAMKAKAAAA